MSMRIEQKFAALAKKKRKALITFVMGGDPDIKTSEEIISAVAEAGADILEIGMPFSDPMADGTTIQAAGLRSLGTGTKLRDIITLVKSFRKKDSTTPVILMGYYNPVYIYGVEKFCADAEAAGVDGVILVDLPPEEENEFTDSANKHGIKLIRLIAPTTGDVRLAALSKNAGGFLYYIAVVGITGGKSADLKTLKAKVEHIKSQTPLPVAVGFGIKTLQQAKDIAEFSDAVVVGSALVEIIAGGSVQKAAEFVKSLRTALDEL